MRFERYLRLFSVTLVATGLLSILITQSYILATTIGLGVALLYAILGERLTSFAPKHRWLWNTTALLLLGYFTHDSLFGSLDLVGNGITFVVYLQIIKLLSPKTDRDWLQIYTLSFVHLLASTVLSVDVSFAFPFVIYVVVATWTLVMFNLKLAQQEAARPERRSTVIRNLFQSKEIITRRFLATTSFLSIAIIIITLIIFFSFPRLSMGQFLKRIARTQRVAGFSEQVELGTIGSIKTNNSIAFRVEIPERVIPEIDIDHLYWRGTAADFFDGRSWTQTYRRRNRVRLDLEKPYFETERASFPGGKTFSYRVFLEAMSTPFIFGADRLSSITWSKTLLEKVFRGSLWLEQSHMYQSYRFRNARGFLADLTYRGESTIGEPEPDLLREETEIFPDWVQSYYLQLPAIDPDVERLIRNIPVPAGAMYDRVVAIQRYLEKNYRYTLDVQDVGTTDPLRFFFLERKEGHCEYFSTALAIALRMHGIPSREAMGFRGGELNPYGGFIAVRQRDAHSWVEVFFPKAGWIRFDPSPLDSTVRTLSSFMQPTLQFIDYLRLRWDKYIIEYDLRAQAAIFEKIGRRLSKMSRTEQDDTASTFGEDARSKIVRGWPGKLALALTGLFLLLLLLHIQKQRRRSTTIGRYRVVVRLLASRGYQKHLYETAKEFQTRVEKKESALPSLQTLTDLYYEERFGDQPCDEGNWNDQVKQLKRDLATRLVTTRRAA